jgi:LDH2 family malate/lactate/ureidoglycolate dehydrogenase
MDEETFAAETLRAFAQQVFERLCMPVDEAAVMADHLVWADLRGASWLGVRKIPQYAARMREGGTKRAAELVTISDGPALALLDALDSWGQVVGVRAMRLAMDKARTTGVGVVVVRNTTSAGTLGYFAAQAAGEGLIGLAINNSPPLQVATGGAAKVVGNQAFAVAAPADRHEVLLLDMATSATSLASIHAHAQRGEPLPEGVALDASGRPTTDPAAALGGLLLPMGGHRGYGLALMWEVLTGVLAGGPRFAANVTMPDDHGRPQGVSMFLLAVDPATVLGDGALPARVDELIDQMHGSPTAPGVERVAVPGERGHALATARRRDGIPLPAELVARLKELAGVLGVPGP